MHIREMTVDDIEYLELVEKDLFSSPWSKDDFIYEIKANPFAHLYVIEDTQMIGYIDFWIMYEQATLANIGVRREYQRKGYASLLIEHMLDEVKHCENVTLEVRVSNVSAINLYKKYGFEIQALRKDYYKDNHEDAYLMLKRMEG